MTCTHRVLVCDNVAPAGIALLRESVDVVEGGSLGQPELIDALQGCQGLIVRSATKVTATVFENAPDLRVVARAGVGVDNIDLAAATRQGVLVVNSPAGNILAAAEHTIAMLLSAARNIPQADASMKAGEFDRKRFVGRQVVGKTLGIIGLGKIGTEVARRARAMGMELIVHDPYATPEAIEALGAREAALDDLLASSDFLTVHVPLTDETRGLVDAAALAKLPDHAVVVNCARGGIIDEAALLRALNSDEVAGAALDVFVGEPTVNRELVEHPRVIATPHLGASTSEAQETVVIDAAQQILDVLAGRPPSSPVNVPALAPELMSELNPYLSVAEKLARLANVLVSRVPSEVSLMASASAPAGGLPLLTSKIIAGILSSRTDQTVNEINAPLVARERGIKVSHSIAVEDPGYSRHLEATVQFGDATCRLAGAAIEGSLPRILRVDGFSVDLVPEGRVIVIWKRSPRVPGFIAAIGAILGDNGVGISTIQVGREEIDGTGMLIACIDQPLAEDVREAIVRHPDVIRLEVVTFD